MFNTIVDNHVKLKEAKEDLRLFNEMVDDKYKGEIPTIAKIRFLEKLPHKISDMVARTGGSVARNIYPMDEFVTNSNNSKFFENLNKVMRDSNDHIMSTDNNDVLMEKALYLYNQDFREFLHHNKKYTSVFRARNFINWFKRGNINPLELLDGFRRLPKLSEKDLNNPKKFNDRLLEFLEDAGMDKSLFMRMVANNLEQDFKFENTENYDLNYKNLTGYTLVQQAFVHYDTNGNTPTEYKDLVERLEKKYEVEIIIQSNIRLHNTIEINALREDISKAEQDLLRLAELISEIEELVGLEIEEKDGIKRFKDNEKFIEYLNDIVTFEAFIYSRPKLKSSHVDEEIRTYGELYREVNNIH